MTSLVADASPFIAAFIAAFIAVVAWLTLAAADLTGSASGFARPTRSRRPASAKPDIVATAASASARATAYSTKPYPRCPTPPRAAAARAAAFAALVPSPALPDVLSTRWHETNGPKVAKSALEFALAE